MRTLVVQNRREKLRAVGVFVFPMNASFERFPTTLMLTGGAREFSVTYFRPWGGASLMYKTSFHHALKLLRRVWKLWMKLTFSKIQFAPRSFDAPIGAFIDVV